MDVLEQTMVQYLKTQTVYRLNMFCSAVEKTDAIDGADLPDDIKKTLRGEWNHLKTQTCLAFNAYMDELATLDETTPAFRFGDSEYEENEFVNAFRAHKKTLADTNAKKESAEGTPEPLRVAG